MNSRGDPWNRGLPLYAYNANDQLTTEVSSANGTTVYTYDVNGSLTNKANEGKFSYQYGYDLRNRLATASITRKEGTADVTITSSYAYNTAGIRTRALQTINGITQNRYFLLDDSHTGYAQVFEETAELGGSIVRSYTIGDDVLSQTVAGVTCHLLYDGHGSTRQLADSNGAVTANYTYDAYGKMLGGNPGVTDGKKSATDLLYAGEQFDPGLQMEYLRARYYDQDNGRFNRLDPFAGNSEDPQSLHKYAYAHCDPVNGIDPSGNMLVGLLGAMGIQNSLRMLHTDAVSNVFFTVQATLQGVQAGQTAEEIFAEMIFWTVVPVGIFKLAPKLISGIKSFLRALKVNKFSRIASKLSGTTYKGTIYRAITRGGDADAFKIHPDNISANHRYTKPGKGVLYVGTSRDVVKLEVKGASEIYTRKNVEINKLLDIGDPDVIRQFKIDPQDLIKEDYYVITQIIGDAVDNAGYNGIIFPSAKMDGGKNIVLFERALNLIPR